MEWPISLITDLGSLLRHFPKRPPWDDPLTRDSLNITIVSKVMSNMVPLSNEDTLFLVTKMTLSSYNLWFAEARAFKKAHFSTETEKTINKHSISNLPLHIYILSFPFSKNDPFPSALLIRLLWEMFPRIHR